MSQNQPSQLNQIVKYSTVIDPSDAYTTYTIVEIDTNTNWCKIQANVDMNIKPTYTANLTDLIII